MSLQNDNNLAFRGVRVAWHRQVSPAPASATFNDVPASDPAFQYVEALVASGITAGCGNGNYCPERGADAAPDGRLPRQGAGPALAEPLTAASRDGLPGLPSGGIDSRSEDDRR